jgi:hypothetical protein
MFDVAGISNVVSYNPKWLLASVEGIGSKG